MTTSNPSVSAQLESLTVKPDAKLFISADYKAILYIRTSEVFYSLDGIIFREVHQHGFGGSSEVHHLSFEDAHDKCRQHDVWRNGDLVVIDGEKIGRERYTYRGNEDEGKPFITIGGRDYILDDAVVARHRLTVEEVAANELGNIRCMDKDLVIGGTVMQATPHLMQTVLYSRLPKIRKPEYLFCLADGQYVYVSADKYNYSYESFRLFIGKGDSMREVPVRNVSRYRDGGTTYVKTDEGVLFSPTPFGSDKAANWDGQELTKLEPKQFDIIENDDGVTLSAKG